MSTVTDYLEIATSGTGLLHTASGYYVQLRSQTGGGTYTSVAVTDSTGYYTLTGVPPDSYEIWYSKNLAGPWTDSGKTQYVPGTRPWFDVVAYAGADSTGVTDAAPAINTTLTAASGVAPVYVPPGNYLLNNQVNVPSNTTLLMHPRAIFTKNNTGWGFINSASTLGGSGNSNITIKGGVIQVLGTAGGSSHLNMIQVTNLLIEDVVILGAQSASGPAFWMQNVYNAQVRGCRVDVSGNTLGWSNGIWLVSGDHVTISDCIVKSDDDAFAVGTGGGAATNMTDVHDVTITNCVGTSVHARMLDIETGNALNISRVAVSNMTGSGVAAGVAIQALSTGTVTDVQLSNLAPDASVGTYGMVINTVSRLMVSGFVARGPNGNAVIIQGTCANIHLDRCELRTTATSYPVVAASGAVTDLRITNSHISFASPALYAIQLFGGATDGTIDGNQIEGTANSGGGIYFVTTAVTGFRITRNRIKNLQWAFWESAGDFNLWAHNDVRSNTTVWSANPTSTHSQVRSNIGLNPVGSFTAPTFPATGVASAAQVYDASVWIKSGTNAISAIAIGGTTVTVGGTNVTIAAAGAIGGPFRVPAGQTVTLTYTAGGTPAWVWYGD